MLVLDDTSLLNSSDLSITILLFVSLSRCVNPWEILVGDSNWVFKIEFAHQLLPHGFEASLFRPAFVYNSRKLIEKGNFFDTCSVSQI